MVFSIICFSIGMNIYYKYIITKTQYKNKELKETITKLNAIISEQRQAIVSYKILKRNLK